MDYEIRKPDKHVDERGFVFEVLRSENVNAPFGQVFITSVLPGKVKGNHYHKRKKEWFCVVKGEVEFHLKDVDSGEEESFKLGSSGPAVLQINPGTSHALTNSSGEEAIVLVYISESYDKKDADTFEHVVIAP